MKDLYRKLERTAREEVERVQHRLPRELEERVLAVPVTLEHRPDPSLLADGYPDDLLGLFVGLDYALGESGAHDLPAQIILFLDNLWSFAGGDAHVYRDEVRKTYLHELGHFLGLGEDDLEIRGLE